MKTKITLALVIFLSVSSCVSSCAQNYSQEYRKFLALDMLSSGIVSGVGSVIKKPSAKSFISGFCKGAIGGAVCFSSKYFAYEIKRRESLSIGWPIKILNAVGASMIENGAAGRGIVDNIGIDYGFIRLDITKKIRLRVQPFGAVGVSQHFLAGHRFDLKTSLLIGTPSFIQDSPYGVTYINSISCWNKEDHGTYAHEFIHVLQSRSQLSLNYLLKNDRRFFIDLPISDITYAIENLRTDYAGNIYERQARILSERY